MLDTIELIWLGLASTSQIQNYIFFGTSNLTAVFEFRPTSKNPLKFNIKSIDFIRFVQIENLIPKVYVELYKHGTVGTQLSPQHQSEDQKRKRGALISEPRGVSTTATGRRAKRCRCQETSYFDLASGQVRLTSFETRWGGHLWAAPRWRQSSFVDSNQGITQHNVTGAGILLTVILTCESEEES